MLSRVVVNIIIFAADEVMADTGHHWSRDAGRMMCKRRICAGLYFCDTTEEECSSTG